MSRSAFRRAAIAAVLASAACVVETEPEGLEIAGESDEAALTSSAQLRGDAMADKTLSLTFDDGPGDRTEELADYLAEQRIVATFFINGWQLNAQGKDGVALKQHHIDAIVRGGHILANHTQNHKNMTELGAEELRSAVTRTDALIAAAQPDGPWLLRAPFGAWSPSVSATLNAHAATRKYVGSIFWDAGGSLGAKSGADWACWSKNNPQTGKRYTVDECAALYELEIAAKGRGIVLMHDTHGSTVDMTKALVPRLRARGFAFVPVTEAPSVKAAVVASGAKLPEWPRPSPCTSADLGREVAEGTCVQRRVERYFEVCERGAWRAVASASDPACVEGSLFTAPPARGASR